AGGSSQSMVQPGSGLGGGTDRYGRCYLPDVTFFLVHVSTAMLGRSQLGEIYLEGKACPRLDWLSTRMRVRKCARCMTTSWRHAKSTELTISGRRSRTTPRR